MEDVELGSISVDPSSALTKVRIFVLMVLGSFCAATALAAEPVRLAELGWLAGSWKATLANGAEFEAHYTDATGGMIVSVSKEVRRGRAVAFELERFFEQDGRVVYHPYPNGKASEHQFPLVAYDAAAKRATFENKEHDFPQTFVFEQPTKDELVITLSGAGKSLRFELKRR